MKKNKGLGIFKTLSFIANWVRKFQNILEAVDISPVGVQMVHRCVIFSVMSLVPGHQRDWYVCGSRPVLSCRYLVLTGKKLLMS